MKMKKVLSLCLVSMMALTACSKGEQLQEEKDSVPDKKIVSATVSATQVLDKFDANLVGIPTTKTTLPDKYKDLPEVGQAMAPNLEIVASLKPDLFIVDSMFKEKIEKSLKEYDLNAFYFETGTYSKYIESIQKLGTELGKKDEANKIVEEFKLTEKEVAKKAKDGEKPKVAVLFGGGDNFMLATKTSYLGDLVNTVGAENIADGLDGKVDSGYIQFSMEQIVKEDPDYILRFAHGDVEETKKSYEKAFDKNPAWQTLSAVKNGNVVDLDSSVFNVSANIFVKDAIKELGDILYSKK